MKFNFRRQSLLTSWAGIGIIFILGMSVRLFSLSNVPVSLYWDEAAIGYDAFVISQTGKDMHKRPWWQPIYYSYGDYKAPVYPVLVSMTVRLFGPTEMAVRLPSALAGGGLLLLVYGIAFEMWRDKQVAFFAGLFTALSPFGFIFSRGGFEANGGVFLVTASVYVGLLARRYPRLWMAAAGIAALAVYTYFSSRVVIPLLGLGLVGRYRQTLTPRKNRGWLLASLVLFGGLLLPLFFSPFYEASNTFRLSNQNVFSTDAFVLAQNEARELAGNTLLSRVVYHRYWYFTKTLIENLSTHLDPSFMFFWGDSNVRHSTNQAGILLFWSLPVWIAGLYRLWIHTLKDLGFLLWWWAVALFPAILVFEVPHSLRSLNALVPLMLILGLGMNWIWQRYKRLRFLLFGLLIINSLIFFHDYFTHYPSRSALNWQDGYKQLALSVHDYAGKYDRVWVEPLDRWYLYYLFYNQILPSDISQTDLETTAIQQINTVWIRPVQQIEISEGERSVAAIPAGLYDEFQLPHSLLEVIANHDSEPWFYMVELKEGEASEG